MHQRTLIAANWKMHLNVHEGSLLVRRLDKQIRAHRDVEIVLAPSMLCLQPLSVEIDRRKFRLAAQNAYAKDEGAFTGEVSFTMIRDLVHYTLVGHSERRIYFNESLEEIRDKVQAAIRNGISPILCIGETKGERAAGETKQVLHDQLTTALSNLTSEEIDRVVVAYEPVWAISTFDGVLAKPGDVEQAFKLIRAVIAELYGKTAASEVRLLYGGSVNADTAAGYLAVPGCNGLLIGSASLNYQQFTSIIDSAHRLTRESPEQKHDHA